MNNEYSLLSDENLNILFNLINNTLYTPTLQNKDLPKELNIEILTNIDDINSLKMLYLSNSTFRTLLDNPIVLKELVNDNITKRTVLPYYYRDKESVLNPNLNSFQEYYTWYKKNIFTMECTNVPMVCLSGALTENNQEGINKYLIQSIEMPSGSFGINRPIQILPPEHVLFLFHNHPSYQGRGTQSSVVSSMLRNYAYEHKMSGIKVDFSSLEQLMPFLNLIDPRQYIDFVPYPDLLRFVLKHNTLYDIKDILRTYFRENNPSIKSAIDIVNSYDFSDEEFKSIIETYTNHIIVDSIYRDVERLKDTLTVAKQYNLNISDALTKYEAQAQYHNYYNKEIADLIRDFYL